MEKVTKTFIVIWAEGAKSSWDTEVKKTNLDMSPRQVKRETKTAETTPLKNVKSLRVGRAGAVQNHLSLWDAEALGDFMLPVSRGKELKILVGNFRSQVLY